MNGDISMNSRVVTRKAHEQGHSTVVEHRYSPNWWTAEQRKAAYRHQPIGCFIYDDVEPPREFIAFGHIDGAHRAMREILGPVLA